jgi:starvation-inducible DNA-binding protein
MKPNIGIPDANRDGVIKLLAPLLADEYLLYTKTRNYHWNVVGPQFNDLHKFFEAQYEELDGFVDEVAERIRQLGPKSPGTLAEFTKATRLKEHPGQHPDAKGMLSALLADHEAVIQTLRGGSRDRHGQVQRRRHQRLPHRPDGEAREDGLDA